MAVKVQFHSLPGWFLFGLSTGFCRTIIHRFVRLNHKAALEVRLGVVVSKILPEVHTGRHGHYTGSLEIGSSSLDGSRWALAGLRPSRVEGRSSCVLEKNFGRDSIVSQLAVPRIPRESNVDDLTAIPRAAVCDGYRQWSVVMTPRQMSSS